MFQLNGNGNGNGTTQSFLRSKWLALVPILAVIGPGIITANVDNDAGGIATYSLAGANYGYTMLWTALPILVALIIIQEMCARMGVVSGKGLSDLIREAYGAKVTFYLMIGILITNLGNIIGEFAGVASSLEIFGVSKYISVPIAAFIVWILVAKGNPKIVERVFLGACVFYVAYVVSGFLAKPDWMEVAKDVVKPTVKLEKSFIIMLIGIVGTTIAPWMQFYQQASVVEKRIKWSDYKYCRLDTIIGCIVAVVVASFIVLACAATLFQNGIRVETAADAALALKPFAGRFASTLFAFGLFNASLFAASILPLSTSYFICEGLGFESGIGKRFKEAPWFIGIYTVLIIIGAAFILIPRLPLIKIMYASQVINGLVLAPVLVFIIQLINKEWIMGEQVNGPVYNFLAWLTVIVMGGLTAILAVIIIFPNLI